MKISCLNPIAAVGMQLFTDAYEKVDDVLLHLMQHL